MTLTVDAYAGRTFEGKAAPCPARRSARATVEAVVPNEKAEPKPGMSPRRRPAGQQAPAVLVPIGHPDHRRTSRVYVVSGDRVEERRHDVTKLSRWWKLSTAKSGERVATTNVSKLIDG